MQPEKKKRKIKTPRQKLSELLDSLVSKIVRTREPFCVICGSDQTLTNGHLFGRGPTSTRWDITPNGNCHTQCWPCNRKHVFNRYPYERWYISKFGLPAFDALYARWSHSRPLKMFELEELRERLQKELSQDESSLVFDSPF